MRSAFVVLAAAAAGLVASSVVASTPAEAVVMGSPSSLGSHTVQLLGSRHCTGVVIARQAIVTAAHCAGLRVHADGMQVRTAGISRAAILDDGRRVQVSGDAAIIRLASPLPGSVTPVSVGPGSGETYRIAGYGTTDESQKGAFGALHEAGLVKAGGGALVDPRRSGQISASACFGDSGGPVMRGSELVGIVTRAAHPSQPIACGHLTRWAPVVITGGARVMASGR